MIQVPVQVRFADCDMAGHIHNAVYLHYFETGRIRFFVSQLKEKWDWKADGLIVKKNSIVYHKPGRLEDQILVEVSCSHVGTTSFTLNYQIKNEQTTLIAEGESVMVCMNYIAGEIIPIPTIFLEILRKHQN